MPISPIYLPFMVLNPIDAPVVAQIDPPKPVEKPESLKPEPEVKKLTVILVAGANYPHERGKINNLFYNYCKVIAPVLNKKYKDVKIVVFNFVEGQMEEFIFKDNKLAAPKVLKSFDKLNNKNYWFTIEDKTDDSKSKLVTTKPKAGEHTEYYPSISDVWKDSDQPTKQEYIDAFKAGKLTEKSLSVADLYNCIVNIPDKTIIELHIFSHAWLAGPIFANTNSFIFNKKLQDNTKYIDKDGRNYDFKANLKTIPKLADFANKFDTNGFSFIWGCNAYVSPKKIIHAIIEQKDLYKKAVAKPDDKLLVFTYNSDWAEDNKTKFHTLMKDDPANTTNKSDKKSLNDVIAILKEQVEDHTYMKPLAKATKRDVLGALPGTYADLDTTAQSKFGIVIMHVPLGKKFDDDQNFWGVLNFYRKHLSIKFRPEKEYDTKDFGRGYAVYEP